MSIPISSQNDEYSILNFLIISVSQVNNLTKRNSEMQREGIPVGNTMTKRFAKTSISMMELPPDVMEALL